MRLASLSASTSPCGSSSEWSAVSHAADVGRERKVRPTSERDRGVGRSNEGSRPLGHQSLGWAPSRSIDAPIKGLVPLLPLIASC